MNDIKLIPPASVRNTPPLLAVLTRVFAPRRLGPGLVLEIASGSGYHAAAFAKALPHLDWQPSDPDEGARASIAAYVVEARLANLRAPIALDVTRLPWPVARADAMLCINMIHISPWEATIALFDGAQHTLASGAPLVTYGPYVIDGDFQAESNVTFDQSLRARNPTWGIRDLKDIEPLARARGFSLAERIAMPANNHTLVFEKT
ncbi:MAG: class I SAM-dependent methyltransferase [Proteobacteria bacterium]|nr:class I SAM-dependent methyltransferase [Pseudomonadota bacterium]